MPGDSFGKSPGDIRRVNLALLGSIELGACHGLRKELWVESFLNKNDQEIHQT